MAGIILPPGERGRDRGDIRRWDKLTARLARADLSPRQRATAAAERDRLERSPHARAETAWRDAAITETGALAGGRGETVGDYAAGVKRVLDHDPILSLARTRRMTEAQLDTAIRLRTLYDSRAADAGAVEYTGLPGARHDHERFIAARFTRAKASAALGRIERALDPPGLDLVRAICERGLSLSSRADGREFYGNLAVLLRALDVAAPLLP